MVPLIDSPLLVLVLVCVFVLVGVKLAPVQGSINPAINLCTALMSDIAEGRPSSSLYCWIWIGGDLLGVVMGLWVYQHFYAPNRRATLIDTIKQAA